MKSLFPRAAVASILFALASSAPSTAQTYLGPVPYLSMADRPVGFLAGSAVVEDFEDASLDFGLTVNSGSTYGPASNADSVDGDDGVIDGFGRDGHTWFTSGAVTFTFPAPVRQAGIAWTDGSCNAPVTFEAFGPGMVSLGVHGPFVHADCANSGETAEDRLYGVQDPHGIVAIRLHSMGNQSVELDHVQFETLGATVCSSNPNSTGNEGILTLVGSALVIDNEVTLVASRLPRPAFGYFLASRTPGNVPGAGGSQGVLCLGGSIGRFNSAIFNTGTTGHGILAINLGSIPTPTGSVAVHAGESWRFQAWFRDSVGGVATSNFTDAAAISFL